MTPVPMPSRILVRNGGSSSIKWALYDAGRPEEPSLVGTLDRIGSDQATVRWHDYDRPDRRTPRWGCEPRLDRHRGVG